MRKIIKKSIIGLLSLIGALLLFLFVHNLFLSVKYKSPINQANLSEENIKELMFVSNLKSDHGDRIWPGFSDTDLPVILFNEKYEFLLSDQRPDTTWRLMDDQPVNGKQLYIRNVVNSQAFAIKAGDSFAGSIGFREKMNRDMIFGIRSQVPNILSHLIPFFLIDVTPDMHISGLFHEMFHAFQATENENKFFSAGKTYSALQKYPYSDSVFNEYWNKEGYYLKHAIFTEDNERFMAYVDSFLIVRANRRSNEKLDTACIQAEKQLEWLEGLAKYAESRSYTLASSIESEYKFKNKNTYWELERKQQLSKLGKSGGDNRFYHSGAAQAYILDRLDSSWKENIMDDHCFLEDMIRRKFHMD